MVQQQVFFLPSSAASSMNMPVIVEPKEPKYRISTVQLERYRLCRQSVLRFLENLNCTRDGFSASHESLSNGGIMSHAMKKSMRCR